MSSRIQEPLTRLKAAFLRGHLRPRQHRLQFTKKFIKKKKNRKISYEVATKINLWLGVPKTMRNVCFSMIMTHRLKTARLEEYHTRHVAYKKQRLGKLPQRCSEHFNCLEKISSKLLSCQRVQQQAPGSQLMWTVTYTGVGFWQWHLFSVNKPIKTLLFTNSDFGGILTLFGLSCSPSG